MEDDEAESTVWPFRGPRGVVSVLKSIELQPSFLHLPDGAEHIMQIVCVNALRDATDEHLPGLQP